MKSFLKQIDESFKSLQEKSAKPDYLDFDKDGDKEESMKKALKDKEQHEAVKNPGKYKTGMKKGYDRDGDGVPNKADKDPNDGSVTEAAEKIECEKCKGAGCDHCDGKGYHEKVDEMSTTASMGAVPQTPYVFRKADDKTVEALGYKRVSKISNKKMHTEYDQVQEAMDRKYEQLIEGYRDFVLSDSKMSPARKVNASIRDVAKKLKEIEQTVEYTGRLKNESGIAHSGFSTGTHNALRKISERLIKISERVRSLGE